MSLGVQTARPLAVVKRWTGRAPMLLPTPSLTGAQRPLSCPWGHSGRTRCLSALGVWPRGPAHPGALAKEALPRSLLAWAMLRLQQSVPECVLGSGEGHFRGDSHVGHHAHSFPGAAICSPHRAGCGDGDVEVGVIHVVGLWGLAPPAGHLPDNQCPAQPLHDVGELFRSTGRHTAGQNDHTLLGAVAFTCRREGPSRWGLESPPWAARPAFFMLYGRPEGRACFAPLWSRRGHSTFLSPPFLHL